jgi:hypothetical protein
MIVKVRPSNPVPPCVKLASRSAGSASCPPAWDSLVVLFPFTLGAQHLAAPIVELAAPLALAGEVAQLDGRAAVARSLNGSASGISLDIFHV